MIEAKVASVYYTKYDPEREHSHPWNSQYVNLVKLWGDCSNKNVHDHLMCLCRRSLNITSDILLAKASSAIDVVLEQEEALNEALTSTSPLIRERAKVIHARRTARKTQ